MPHRGSDQGEDGRGHGRWRSYSSKQITLMLVLQHLLHTTTGDWCVLYQLGWIDENGKENNETSTADLMSLKPEVIKSGSRKVQSSIQVFIHSMQQRTRFLRSWTSQQWQLALRREWRWSARWWRKSTRGELANLIFKRKKWFISVRKRCANKFSEEDKAELTEIALKIQG